MSSKPLCCSILRGIDANAQENLVISASRRIFKFAKAQRQADSATRLTAQDILRKGIVSVRQLQTLAPNVTIQSMMGTASTNFWIRGIGFNDYTQNNMSSVLTYVDDVAFPYSTMSNGMLFDLQDVEIDPAASFHRPARRNPERSAVRPGVAPD